MVAILDARKWATKMNRYRYSCRYHCRYRCRPAPPPPKENDETLPLRLPSVYCGVDGPLTRRDARENATAAPFERNDHNCN